MIRYGNFFQILHSIPGGHLAVAVETHGDPLAVIAALRPLLARLRAGTAEV